MAKFPLALLAVFLYFITPADTIQAGPPTAEHYDVFIQAEDMVESSGFDVIGLPRALGYSGGKMLSLWKVSEPGAKGYYVKYQINVEKDGDYYVIVWAQGLDTLYSSPFRVSIGQISLYFTESTVKIMSPTSRYGEGIVPHMMGPVRLNAGKHSLRIQVNERRKYPDKAFNLVFDAIGFIREVSGQPPKRQREVNLTIDYRHPSGLFSGMTDVSQGGIREVTDYRFWASLTPVLKKIGTQNVRIDHIFDDKYYGVVTRNELGSLMYQWDKLDAVLSQIIQARARPYLCVSYMPNAISRTQGPYDAPNDLSEWKDICTELVKHVMEKFKLVGLYYEIWNEPDLNVFWKGSQEEYCDLYKASVEAIGKADRYAKVGGPATALVQMPWMRTFLEFVKRKNLQLDFVSWHIYDLNLKLYAQQIRYVREILIGLGFPNRTETIISEWNIRGGLHPDNDAFYNAGHTAGVLKVFQEELLSKSFFFSLKDSSVPNILHGGWGMVTSENEPKPVYKLFEAYARLGGRNLRVNTTDSDVNAFATMDENALKMLVWAYDDGTTFGIPRDVRLKAYTGGTVFFRKKLKQTTFLINSSFIQLPVASKKPHSCLSKTSLIDVTDYFETKFELENGGVEYIELNQVTRGRAKE